MAELSQRADLKRWQLMVFLFLAFAGIGVSIGLGVAVLSIASAQATAQERLDRNQQQIATLVMRLQQNRIQSIADLCRRDNADNFRNIQFVSGLGSSAQTLRLARRIYHLTPDCDAYARGLVRPKPRTSIPPGKP